MTHYPPEWGQQSTVWLSWTSIEPHCAWLRKPSDVIADMAAALVASAVPFVTMLVSDDEAQSEAMEALLTRGVNATQVKFVVLEVDQEWIRDFGPIFLKNGAATLVASFAWNYWGCLEHYKHEYVQEESENASKVAKACASLLKAEVIESWLVSEGGNREFNGAGVLMATSAVELQRNPSRTLEQIEAELKRVFNVSKVIWFEQGVADDDQVFLGPRRQDGDLLLEFNTGATGGHIDEYCKFIGPNKVLLAEVPAYERETPLGSITHARMERALAHLQSEAGYNIDGKPFEIVRIPTPPTMRIKVNRQDAIFSWLENIIFANNGSPMLGKDLLDGISEVFVVVPASYVNMIMCNGTILIPRYGKRSTETPWHFLTQDENDRLLKADEQARMILQQLFPTYNIVQISSVLALNLGGGGMHCTSQQQPL